MQQSDGNKKNIDSQKMYYISIAVIILALLIYLFSEQNLDTVIIYSIGLGLFSGLVLTGLSKIFLELRLAWFFTNLVLLCGNLRYFPRTLVIDFYNYFEITIAAIFLSYGIYALFYSRLLKQVNYITEHHKDN